MNTNMSLGLDTSFSDSLSADTLSIAVIGPDTKLREAAVAVLRSCHQGEVTEFSSYPPSMDDLPRLLQQHHDILLIEWDSDPEIALDLIEGIGASAQSTVMVYSNESDPGQTNPELLMRCMRAGAREFLSMPFSAATASEALVRAAARRPSAPGPKKQLGRLLVFCGSKGGAGVTAIACNFAVSIALESAESTLLIDLDLPLGDAALNLGITHEYSTNDALENFNRLDANFLSSLIVKHESGLYVLAAPGNYSAFQVTDEAILKLLTVARENFRNVVVDAGSKLESTGNATPFRGASTIYLVTQSGIPELRNANRLIVQNTKGNGPNLDVVLNRYESRGMRVSDDDIKRALTMPARWKIPNDYAAMSRMHDTATPVTSTDSSLSRQFAVMARVVCGLPELKEKEKKRGLGFLSFLKSAPANDAPSFQSSRPSAKFMERTSNAPGSSLGLGWTEEASKRLSPTESAYGSREDAAHREEVRKRDELRELDARREREMLLAREAVQRHIPLPSMSVVDERPNLQSAAPQFLEQTHAEEPDYLQGISAVAPLYVPEIETSLPLYIPETYTVEPGYREDTLSALPYAGNPDIPLHVTAPLAASGFEFLPEPSYVLPPTVLEPTVLESRKNETRHDEVMWGSEPTEIEELSFAVDEIATEMEPVVESAIVFWPEPDPISYGTPLSAKQFNATSSLPGSFVYIPAGGYVLPVGKHALWATFSPTDGDADSAVQACVSLEVRKATPLIQWPVPSDLPGGMPLSRVQLNAQATVPGVFTYTPSDGEVPASGSHMLSVSFTPTDLLNYTTAKAEVPLFVSSQASTILWPKPAAIPYGNALGTAQLNATASAQGTFRYAPEAGSVLPVGRHLLRAFFTPADVRSSLPAQAEVTVTVIKERPNILWPAPPSIVYGTPLSGKELNATASVPGVFVYIPGEGAVLAAGKHTPTAIFTPTESANYTTTQTAVSMTVLKATPVLEWPTPKVIPHGTALSEFELNATASVPGVFTYQPEAGVIPDVGTHTLRVTFNPLDAANYAAAEALSTLNVIQATAIKIAWPEPAAISYGTPLSGLQLSAKASVAGSFAYSPQAGEVLSAGRHKLAVRFTPADSRLPATYSEVAFTVTQGRPEITWLAPQPICYGRKLDSTQLNAIASIPGVFSYSAGDSELLPAGIHTLAALFTPTDDTNYAVDRAVVQLVVNKATTTLQWADPEPITYGAALNDAQLNASASVPGTLVYAPAAGTVLAAGIQTLSVTLIPADIANYAMAQATVQLVVRELESFGFLTPTVAESDAHDVHQSPRSFGATVVAQRRWVEETLQSSAQLRNPATVPDARTEFAPNAEYAESTQEPVETTQEPVESWRALEQQVASEMRTYKGVTYLKRADGQWHPLE